MSTGNISETNEQLIPVRSEYDELIEEVRRLRDMLIRLTAQRDDLILHICPALQALYEEKLGCIEREILAAEMYIREKRRILEILRSQLNRQEEISYQDAEKAAAGERRQFEQELDRKSREAEEARNKWQNSGWSDYEDCGDSGNDSCPEDDFEETFRENGSFENDFYDDSRDVEQVNRKSSIGRKIKSLYRNLYMREFVIPGEMNAVPRYGCDGSYAVTAIELSEIADESGPQLSGIYAIKVINGEERGNFRRTLSGAERDEMRKAIQAFDKFTCYLPLVGHGIEGEKLDVLSEAYGTFLGIPLSNRIIDTKKMGRIHLSDVQDTSLLSYAKRLGITCDAESEPERECRIVWSFYQKLERSELERHDIYDAAKRDP